MKKTEIFPQFLSRVTSKFKKPLQPTSFIKWVLALVWFVIAIFPIWWMFTIVFTRGGGSVSIDPNLFPNSIAAGIENISNALRENQFMRAYFVTTLYAVVQIGGEILLCSMAAYEFALFKFPFKRALFFIALSAMMIPQAVTLIPTYLLVVDLKWLNTIQGLAVPGMASAFGLFLLTQFMEKLPQEMIQAASIDGASHFGIFWKIILPLSKNGIITLAILAFTLTWGNYLWPFIISTKPAWYTISVLVAGFNRHDSWVTIDTVMTVSFLASLPPLIFYIIFQRQIVEGIAVTGLKG